VVWLNRPPFIHPAIVLDLRKMLDLPSRVWITYGAAEASAREDEVKWD
jgi:hypothetical protein